MQGFQFESLEIHGSMASHVTQHALTSGPVAGPDEKQQQTFNPFDFVTHIEGFRAAPTACLGPEYPSSSIVFSHLAWDFVRFFLGYTFGWNQTTTPNQDHYSTSFRSTSICYKPKHAHVALRRFSIFLSLVSGCRIPFRKRLPSLCFGVNRSALQTL